MLSNHVTFLKSACHSWIYSLPDFTYSLHSASWLQKQNNNDRWDYYTTSFCPESILPSLKYQTGKKQDTFLSGFCPQDEPCFHNRIIWRTLFFNKLLLWYHWAEVSFSVWCRVLPERRETWWYTLLNICSLDTSPHQQCGFQRHESDLSLPMHSHTDSHTDTHTHTEAWHPAASLTKVFWFCTMWCSTVLVNCGSL